MTSKLKEESMDKNISFNQDSTVRKRRGWRTFADMVHELWMQNKRLKKLGMQMDYTLRLPLKGYKPVYKRTKP